MRVEPYSVDSIVHCIKRGGRGLPIFKNKADYYRCIRSLYYLNDSFFDKNWNEIALENAKRNSQTIPQSKDRLFFRPDHWPSRQPLVKILCYILMPNHVHLLLKEIQEGGITIFMKKFGQSMTNHFNIKYETKGSIFQGSYKGKVVDEDVYLQYLSIYIMVKNAFELFHGGLEVARQNFDEAWRFAVSYPFSSLADYDATTRNSPIIDKDLLEDILGNPKEFKEFAKNVIGESKWTDDKALSELLLEKE